MSLDLYIYYRVAAENAEALQGRVAAMQERLAPGCGVKAALRRRPGTKDGRQTWMEIYQAVPDGFETLLAQAVADAGLAPLIDGERHTEHFVDFPPCA